MVATLPTCSDKQTEDLNDFHILKVGNPYKCSLLATGLPDFSLTLTGLLPKLSFLQHF